MFKESWCDRLDRYFVYFVFGTLGIYPFLIYFDPHRNLINTGWEYYLPFLATFLSVFVIYRKATEKKLRTLTTAFSKETNKLMLKKYLTQQGFTPQRNSESIVVYTEPTSDFNTECKRSYIFLLNDSTIYFTVIQDKSRLSTPTFTAHYFLRKDLQKLFSSNK